MNKRYIPLETYIKNLYMEDVHSASIAGMDAVTLKLKSININLSEEQEEEVYSALETVLEKLGNGNYRHYN